MAIKYSTQKKDITQDKFKKKMAMKYTQKKDITQDNIV